MPGARITYTVKRAGTERELSPTLAKMPEDPLQRMVGAHMLEHATVQTAQK